MDESVMRILIVKTSSMGDVVHALPLAADLATHVPGAHIDWLVEESFAAIPAMSRYVARVHAVALRRWRRTPFGAQAWREAGTVRRTLRSAGYDHVLDVQGLLKSAFVARWTAAPIAGPSSASARERMAALFYTQRIDVPRELHAVERCRRVGAAVFGYAIDRPPQFDLRVDAQLAVADAASTAVLLVNASRATKLWDEANWLALERTFAERGLTSVLFWGSAEEGERARRLAAQMQRAVVAPRSPLDVIAATLQRAQLVVGLDTGLTHLAAALGRPTVGIFCDYDPRLVGLVGDGPVRSVGGVGQSPAVEMVVAAAHDVLGATP